MQEAFNAALDEMSVTKLSPHNKEINDVITKIKDTVTFGGRAQSMLATKSSKDLMNFAAGGFNKTQRQFSGKKPRQPVPLVMSPTNAMVS